MRRLAAVLVTATFVAPAAPAAGETGSHETAFLHGRIDAAALRDRLCAAPERRSTGALCDDEPARATLMFERQRRAHWTMKGPDALWGAVARGDMTPAFARTMHDHCFGLERKRVATH